MLAAIAALLVLAAARRPSPCTIFVSNEKDNTVTVLDSETLKIVKTIKTARRPRGIIAEPDYKELFVAAAMATSSMSSTREARGRRGSSTPDPTPS